MTGQTQPESNLTGVCDQAVPGAYCLVFCVEQARQVYLGRFGEVTLNPGHYLYVGSALGPGGLRGRLAHHQRPVVKPHWHVDWLRQQIPVISLLYRASDQPIECEWVQALLRLPGARAAVPGFGASDCRSGCPAHLVYLP